MRMNRLHPSISPLIPPPSTMLPATRPLARTAALAATRVASRSTPSAAVRALHNKSDPAIPGDATGFLPGDKITGETQIGSYPNMPMYNQQWRDANPSAGYWDRQDRRNFGETVNCADHPSVWSNSFEFGLFHNSRKLGMPHGHATRLDLRNSSGDARRETTNGKDTQTLLKATATSMDHHFFLSGSNMILTITRIASCAG